MTRTPYQLFALCMALSLPLALAAQESCGFTGAPFLLSATETICANSDGPTRVSFVIGNRNAPGTYLVSFPDGVDTVLTDVTGQVDVVHYFDFTCDNLPGNPGRPSPSARYFQYQGELTVTRTDCLDNLGEQSSSSYNFNVVPNPIIGIDNSEVDCISEPYTATLEVDVCSRNLIDTYQWYVDGVAVAGATGEQLEDYNFGGPGNYLVRLEARDFFDCGPFTFEKMIEVTSGPTLDAGLIIDSTQLCSSTVVIGTTLTSLNASEFNWTSNSPEVTFSDPSAPTPTITINNTSPGVRRITVTASNDNCPPVSETLRIRTFDGQTITLDRELITCTETPFEFCDGLTFEPEPVSITWTASDPSIIIQGENTKCPITTFRAGGEFVLTASGQDICGGAFSIPITVRAREQQTVSTDFSTVDTLCVTSPPVNLLDFVSPGNYIASCSGPGVDDCFFDPSGQGGLNTISFLDSCTNETTVDIFVLTEGGFSGGNPVLCIGETLDLAAIQSGTYSGPGVTNGVFTSAAVGAGRYTIDFTSTAFCGGNGQFDIRVVDFPVAEFAVATPGCQGGAAGAVYPGDAAIDFTNLSATDVLCYRVLETGQEVCGQNDAAIDFPAAGVYTVRQIVATGSGDCRDSTDMQLEIIDPFSPEFLLTIDSSGCDTVIFQFQDLNTSPEIDYAWSFGDGTMSTEASPTVRVARPFVPESFTATVSATNGCFTRDTTFTENLALRFQVSFNVLNDNSTVCSDETIRLVNTSTSFESLLITYPNGTTATALPTELIVSNPTDEILPYVIRLEGFRTGCPSQVVTDTVFVLPVSTRAAFSLNYSDNCSPVSVELENSSTPGAIDFVDWGDGSSLQPVGSLGSLVHTYNVARDTTVMISMISRQCGIDTFTASLALRAAPSAAFQIFDDGGRCIDNEFTFRPEDALAGLSLDWEFGDGQFSNLSQPRHRYNEAGTYRTVLTVTNANGCASTDTVAITVEEFTGSPATVLLPRNICVNAPLNLAVSGNVAGLEFDYGNGLVSGEQLSKPYQQEGEFLLSVTSIDANGCRVDTSSLITVHPEFSASIQPDQATVTVQFGDELELSFSTSPFRNLDSVRWVGDSVRSPASLLTSVFPVRDQLYELMVTDEFGCLATDSILVNVAKNLDERIFAPNAFSPNGDGTNDFFNIWAKPNTVLGLNFFRIFTRWGSEVYSCTECQPGSAIYRWDGRLNGDYLGPGVFVWTAEVVFVDGSVRTFMGDVTLLR